MEKYTFKDLKEAVNKLNDEQLLEEVTVQREDEAICINELAVTEDDIYRNVNDEEDCGSLEELELDVNDAAFKNYKLYVKKGTPFLSEDF